MATQHHTQKLSDLAVIVAPEKDDVAVAKQAIAGGTALTWHDEALTVHADIPAGHRFAIRGVPAGRFAVHERERGYDLQLEVGGAMRVWTVPKEPSLDPAAKRLAIELPAPGAAGEALVWDEGVYEQGGRVPWPDALDRGYAVFVLHGARLRGGFALQRTGGGAKPRWLLIKRRDEEARAGG